VRVYLGSDHAGFELKGLLAAALDAAGHEVVDVGPHQFDPEDDYPAYCLATAAAVVGDAGSLGVVIGGSGNGEQIAANKVTGVRAALCTDAATAAGARKWNDANALAISLRSTSQAELAEILDAWFEAEPSAEADDLANVDHLGEIE